MTAPRIDPWEEGRFEALALIHKHCVSAVHNAITLRRLWSAGPTTLLRQTDAQAKQRQENATNTQYITSQMASLRLKIFNASGPVFGSCCFMASATARGRPTGHGWRAASEQTLLSRGCHWRGQARATKCACAAPCACMCALQTMDICGR